MTKAHVSIVMGGALFLLGAIWIRDQRVRMSPVPGAVQVRDQGAPEPATPSPSPDAEDWISFQSGDLRQVAIETGEILHLGVDTRGTPPGTWKHVGVRRERSVDLREGAVVSMTLEWPDSVDCSSMTASLTLSPIAVTGDPRTTSDWIELSCQGTGVGAGRLVVASSKNGVESLDYSEKSTTPDFDGRLLSTLNFRLSLYHGRVNVEVNDIALATVSADNLAGRSCHLYLLLSSDSNFPLRGVHFSHLNIPVRD